MEEHENYGPQTEKDEAKFSVRIPRPIWKLAKLNDIETGESMNALITRLLTEYFRKQGKLPK